MDELSRFWHDLLARPNGPFAFRFVLQPLMATFFAVRDGRRDAKTGRPAYFWGLFTADKERRRALLKSGWQSIGKLLLFAFALDIIYQLIVIKQIRPLEAVVVALMLAALPYLLIRGPVNRASRRDF